MSLKVKNAKGVVCFAQFTETMLLWYLVSHALSISITKHFVRSQAKINKERKRRSKSEERKMRKKCNYPL